MGAILRHVPWMTLVLSTTGCVVPIPASPEETGDGGLINADPVIEKGSPIDFPGPLTLRPGEAINLSVTVRDANITDTLYVRVFKNYASSQGYIQSQTVTNDPRNGTEERVPTMLQTQNWCLGNAGQTVQIDVVVADRPYDPSNLIAPVFKAVPDGKRTERNYLVTCAQPL